MNNKGQFQGNILIGMLFFTLAVGMFIAWISPLYDILSISMQSDNLNCKGYLHNGQNSSQNPLAFNSTLNGGDSGSPLGCVGVRLMLPFLIFVFIIGGVYSLLYGPQPTTQGIQYQ